jgi:predicted aminopeptidase
MEKMITIEIPQAEAAKFSAELERLVAHWENTEAESLEREAISARRHAEFDQMIASIRQSLDRIDQYQTASCDYWREANRQQSLELERLRLEYHRLREQKERLALPPARTPRKSKKS